MLLDLFTGNRLARRAADAGLVTYSRWRTSALDRLDVSETQRQVLLGLLHKARHTAFGRAHGFARIRTVEEYQSAVPVGDYESFWKDYWQPAFPRLEGTTWPDPIPYYALSSGTTSGTTKYIPISKEMLASNRKAAFTTVALFRSFAPKANIFGGRIFFLGGNTELRTESNGSRSGDLSAIAAIEISSVTRPYTFPPKELSGIADWTVKVRRLAEASANLPITAISGVPAWIEVLFARLKEVTGKDRIADIWPTLRMLIHGGTTFDGHRDKFRADVGPDVHFVEVYPCSEGFVATEDPRHKLLRVVPDNGIFFEFIPAEEFEDGKLKTDRPVRHTLANVETGVDYAVALTTCAGLWSYQVGDKVRFERRDPPLLRFAGRTKYFLSAFGEHLIEDEIAKALHEAATATQADVGEWHVGPVFSDDPRKPGHHRYLIEFRTPPADAARFATVLDDTLRRLNEDYDAHRQGDLTMLRPVVQALKPEAFMRWMLAHGKRPPQHKVPRMDNSGKLTKGIGDWMGANGEIA
jgi:hypothetical protein